MPAVYFVGYAIGLYGLVLLAHKAGQNARRREAIEGEFGADFETGFEPMKRQWWITLTYQRGPGYRWTRPKYMNFFERVDASMALPKTITAKSDWFYNGTRWVEDLDIPRKMASDPRYGEILARR